VKLGGAASAAEESPPPAPASAASGIASANTAAATIAIRTTLRMLGVICTPKPAKLAADLADGAMDLERVTERGQEISVTLGGSQHFGERVLATR
jgi:hypothetical protein